MLYASPEQLDMLVKWSRSGAGQFDPDPMNRTNYARRAFLNGMARLIRLWDLGKEYEELRYEISRRNLKDMSEALRLELVRQARLRCLVTPLGQERVPLFGMQLEIMVRISWGSTLIESADLMGVGMRSVSNALWRARKQTGTLTTHELLSCAYRNLWLPTASELSDLDDPMQVLMLDADRARLAPYRKAEAA